MPFISLHSKKINQICFTKYDFKPVFILLLFLILNFGCKNNTTEAENNGISGISNETIDLQDPVLITTEQGLLRNQVYALTACPNGDVWFGYGVNGGGITRLRGNAYETFTQEDGLQRNYIHALACDTNNLVWIGYGENAGGLSVFDGQDFITFTTDNGLHSNYVASITVRPSGAVFVAYANQRSGVTRFN